MLGWIAAAGGGLASDSGFAVSSRTVYRSTSLIRNSTPLGPYSRTMHRALWWSWGVGRFYWGGTLVWRTLHPNAPTGGSGFAVGCLRTTTCRIVKRFQGRLVFKAHRLVHHSTLGSRVVMNILLYHSTPGPRVIKKKKKETDRSGTPKRLSPPASVSGPLMA